MTLSDLCEPLFLYLCRLSRRHRAGDAPSARRVREELAALLSDLRARAALSSALLSQLQRTEPALILCIDHAIRTGPWPCSKSWAAPSARAAISGDDDPARFFALLRENLDDPSQAADERLEVLAACAALAFVDTSLSEAYRAALDQLRLRLALDAPGPLCPAAYAHTSTADLTRSNPRAAIAFVGVGLLAITLVSAAASYRAGGARLAALYRQVIAADSGGDVASAEPPP